MTPSAAIQALNGRPGLVRLIDGVLVVEPLYPVPGPWLAQNIIANVCETFRVPRATLMGPSRMSTHATARMAAYYLLRERRGLTLPQIAKLMGRDHTTINSGLYQIRHRMACDPALKAKIEGCA